MKKIIKVLLLMALAMQLMVLNVYAVSQNPQKPVSVHTKSILLSKDKKEDKKSERAIKRGEFFIGADIAISDKGNGNIGGLGTAYLAVPVEEVYITLYLDQYDDEHDDWRQVGYYDAVK